MLAPLVAPHDPYDLASLSLLDATDPPAWLKDGTWSYPLGTDNQGRDVLSAILYGTRLSLLVGCSAVVAALLLGVTLGLVAGWRGGIADTLIMRVADVQLSFPAILIALLIDGVAHSVLPRQVQTQITFYVLVAAIALSYWVHFARTVRGSTMVERNKEYIQAAQVIGVHPADCDRPPAAQCDRAGAGHCDDQPRDRDPDGGDVVVSRRRPAADRTLARHADPRRQ